MAVDHSALDELIAFCLEAERLGVTFDPAELLQRYPDAAEELAEFLEDHLAFKAMAVPLQAEESPAANRSQLFSPTLVPASRSSNSGTAERGSEEEGCGRLGKYRLIREIGRGGMGVVYEAWQEGVNRLVAVKVISSGPFASGEELRRFRIEAEAAAHLSHPGLVPIYEVDVCEGRPFYSMELVTGESLSDLAVKQAVPPLRAAEIVAAIADALAYAHARGVVHRDLKPANVLIDATGRPRVTDFGLAKRLAPEQPENSQLSGDAPTAFHPAGGNLTCTGAIVGTPSYMSPEQAAGIKEIGPAVDVYALGAILYTLLAGCPPFRGSHPLEILQAVLESRPESLRRIAPETPADLATIAHKCLEKNPADRYSGASELAADLRRFLAGEPIQAAGLSLWGRFARAVGQSRHESHFRHWGRVIIGFGGIIFLGHLVMALLSWADVNVWWSFLPPRFLMFAALVGLLRWSRKGSLLPGDSVERLVWIVWTSYLLAFFTGTTVVALNGEPYESFYPYGAILAGMGFFILGCHVWGACYIVGLTFFLSAPLMALAPEYAILNFGILWAAALIALGLRYERLNRMLPTDGE